MRDRSAFYETTYSTGGADVQTRVRYETYDEDLGQAGWLQAAETCEFASWLGTGVRVMLDVACGSGGISAFLAAELAAAVVGIDNDRNAIAAANERGAEGCSSQIADANERLPFADGSFDVVFSNDSVHHLRDRFAVLRDWARVLRPGGQLLFTEGLVLTGPVSNEEVRRRTFMGFFVLTPVGSNERAIEAAGLDLVRSEDRSDAVADVGGRTASRSRTVPERADRHRRHRGVRFRPGIPRCGRRLGSRAATVAVGVPCPKAGLVSLADAPTTRVAGQGR